MRTLLVLVLVGAAAACDASGGDATPTAAAAAPVVLGGQVLQPEAAPAEPATAQAEPGTQPESQPTPVPDSEQGDRRPGPLAPGESGHYGAPFTIQTAPISLAEALRTCVGTGQPCLVRGTVERVCQVSGCWFTVAAPDVQATVRIRMQDYGFFVPRNAMNAAVTFEGTLELEEVPQEQAQHYADDEAAAGGERRVVDGPELTYEFMISGAEMSLPEG